MMMEVRWQLERGVYSFSHAGHPVETEVVEKKEKEIGTMGQESQPYSYELELHGKRPRICVVRSLS